MTACLVLGTLINHSNKALKQVQVSLQISKLGHLSQQEEDLDLKVARSYTILSHLYSNHIYFIFSFQFVKSWIQLLVNEICFHMWGGKLASLENLILKKFSWAYLNKIGSNFANSYWLLLAIHPIFAIGIIQGTWNQVISGTSTLWSTLKVYLTQMFGCSNSNKMISMIMMWFLSTKENSGQNYNIFQLFSVK